MPAERYPGLCAWVPAAAPPFFGVDRTYKKPEKLSTTQRLRGVVAGGLPSLARGIFWAPTDLCMWVRARASDVLHETANHTDWFKTHHKRRS